MSPPLYLRDRYSATGLLIASVELGFSLSSLGVELSTLWAPWQWHQVVWSLAASLISCLYLGQVWQCSPHLRGSPMSMPLPDWVSEVSSHWVLCSLELHWAVASGCQASLCLPVRLLSLLVEVSSAPLTLDGYLWACRSQLSIWGPLLFLKLGLRSFELRVAVMPGCWAIYCLPGGLLAEWASCAPLTMKGLMRGHRFPSGHLWADAPESVLWLLWLSWRYSPHMEGSFYELRHSIYMCSEHAVSHRIICCSLSVPQSRKVPRLV